MALLEWKKMKHSAGQEIAYLGKVEVGGIWDSIDGDGWRRRCLFEGVNQRMILQEKQAAKDAVEKAVAKFLKRAGLKQEGK